MKVLNNNSFNGPLLIPCSIYPMLNDNSSANIVKLNAILKLTCLLHDNIIFPGSIALDSDIITNLLVANSDFVRAGIITLTMRSSCSTFHDLVKTRCGTKLSEDQLRRASFFDNICPQVFSFDAEDTSNIFKASLRNYVYQLKTRARKNLIIEQYDKALSEIDNTNGLFSKHKAHKLTNDININAKVYKAAKLLYSLAGAEVTKSQATIPNSYLRTIHDVSTADYIASTGEYPPIQMAHSSLLTYFSVEASAISKLSAREIIELKNSSTSVMMLNELKQIVRHIEDEYVSQRTSNSGIMKECKLVSQAIENEVYKRCEKEVGISKYEKVADHIIYDGAGTVIPLLTTSKKIILWMGKRLSRYKPFHFLDKSTTPLLYYVDRYKEVTQGMPIVGSIDVIK